MKLLYCQNCSDIVKLSLEWQKCKCQESGGRYIDNLNAEYEGDCVPLGFNNHSLTRAIKNQPEAGSEGKTFIAFVIPKDCRTMERID